MNIVRTISPNDAMLHEADSAHYFAVGASATEQIDAALHAAGNPDISRVLDFPCGHGRVARWLRARFPKAHLTVSDLDEDGVRFCAATFDATAVPSSTDFDTLEFGSRFDLIFVGSLLTHVSRDDAIRLLRFLLRCLSEAGVAVVSSHGALVVGRSQIATLEKRGAYGLSYESNTRALEDYFKEGVGYAGYPAQPEYGISYIRRAWLEQKLPSLGAELVLYRDHAWDDHHDVAAFRRAAP